MAERGFPCARPLTTAIDVGALAVHAEEYRPGGDMLRGDSPDVAVRYAAVFARLMAELGDVTVAPPLPNPRWARWDHPGSGVWPPIDFLDDRDQSAVPVSVVDTAHRARDRLLAADLPCLLGHADFEAQNLRWHGQEIWAVHDWDSLAWQPEAALVGVASGAFASAGPPTLAPQPGLRRDTRPGPTVLGSRLDHDDRSIGQPEPEHQRDLVEPEEHVGGCGTQMVQTPPRQPVRQLLPRRSVVARHVDDCAMSSPNSPAAKSGQGARLAMTASTT